MRGNLSEEFYGMIRITNRPYVSEFYLVRFVLLGLSDLAMMAEEQALKSL